MNYKYEIKHENKDNKRIWVAVLIKYDVFGIKDEVIEKTLEAECPTSLFVKISQEKFNNKMLNNY